MKRVLFSFAALAALLVASSNAQAGLQILYSTDGSTYTPTTLVAVPAGGFGIGSPIVAGGGTSITINDAEIFTTSPGDPGHSSLEGISANLNNSAGTGTVYLKFESTDYNNSNVGAALARFEQSLTNNNGLHGVAANATVTLTSYLSAADAQDASVAPTETTGPIVVAGVGSAVSHTDFPSSVLSGPGGTFSLTEIVKISFSGAGQNTVTATANVTPEPATLAAWGCGLGLIGLVRRRRRAAQTA